MRGHRDLSLAVVAAVVCGLVAAIVPLEAVRVVAAIPLALWLPGFAIVEAAFGPRQLDRPQFVLLSLAMSLATLAVAGILLNALPGGLTTLSWALLLVIVVVCGAGLAAIRRGRRRRRPEQPRLELKRRDIVLLAGAGVLAVAAIALAQVRFPAHDVEGYSALWILPSDRSEKAVAVGVISAEQDSASFILTVRGARPGPPLKRTVRLDPGQELSFDLPVAARSGGAPQKVVASLYRASWPQRLFRRATTWLNGSKSFR
jgi:hypothetical protein